MTDAEDFVSQPGVPPSLICAEISRPNGKKLANPPRVPLTGPGCDSILYPILLQASVSTNSYSADYEMAIVSGQALSILATAVDEALAEVDVRPDEWLEYDKYHVTNSQLRATTERLQELVQYAITNSLSVTLEFD